MIINCSGMAGQGAKSLGYNGKACLGEILGNHSGMAGQRATSSRMTRFWRLPDPICGKVLDFCVLAFTEEFLGENIGFDGFRHEKNNVSHSLVCKFVDNCSVVRQSCSTFLRNTFFRIASCPNSCRIKLIFDQLKILETTVGLIC